MSEAVKRMKPQDLIDGGYLQEVNRTFFHPLGLAMWVNPDTGTMGVYDDKEDREGWYFGGEYSELAEKSAMIRAELEDRYKDRMDSLGYIIQPTEDAKQDED